MEDLRREVFEIRILLRRVKIKLSHARLAFVNRRESRFLSQFQWILARTTMQNVSTRLPDANHFRHVSHSKPSVIPREKREVDVSLLIFTVLSIPAG